MGCLPSKSPRPQPHDLSASGLALSELHRWKSSIEVLVSVLRCSTAVPPCVEHLVSTAQLLHVKSVPPRGYTENCIWAVICEVHTIESDRFW